MSEAKEGDDVAAPGWDAINAALKPLYGDREPLHYGTLTASTRISSGGRTGIT